MLVSPSIKWFPCPQILVSIWRLSKKGNLIKLFYLDAATKQASRILRKSEQDKKAANAQNIKKNLNKIQEMLPGKKK